MQVYFSVDEFILIMDALETAMEDRAEQARYTNDKDDQESIVNAKDALSRLYDKLAELLTERTAADCPHPKAAGVAAYYRVGSEEQLTEESLPLSSP